MNNVETTPLLKEEVVELLDRAMGWVLGPGGSLVGIGYDGDLRIEGNNRILSFNRTIVEMTVEANEYIREFYDLERKKVDKILRANCLKGIRDLMKKHNEE